VKARVFRIGNSSFSAAARSPVDIDRSLIVGGLLSIFLVG
jgi:hypothetical protein